jgi:signal transduction histidine kinase
VNSLPIRARLTGVFAVAMSVVLAGAALFVYVTVRSGLDEALDERLAARADAVVALWRPGSRPAAPEAASPDPEEAFAQVLDRGGRLVASAGGARRAAVPAALVRRAAAERVLAELEVPGIEGRARVLAQPLAGSAGIAVVGQSLGDRDETLGALAGAFAIGGPLAVLLASMLGYALATAALRPVEAMRRRAGAVAVGHEDERLPLPEARDEIRRLGETLNAMLDRLWRSFERERGFVADASHELRTPIAVLKTELEALLRAGDHSPQTREALLAAVEETDRLAQLSEDLLVLARTSEAGLPLRAEELPVGELLQSVRERFVDRAAEQGRTIAIDAPGTLTVRGDPLRLRQALGNLVDNALRHGDGTIALSARACEGRVEIDVADAGPGFPAEFAARAFERFARADESRGRGGAGLGLAIVRAIAEAHGGEVQVVRGAGPGARVRLRLA